MIISISELGKDIYLPAVKGWKKKTQPVLIFTVKSVIFVCLISIYLLCSKIPKVFVG